MNNHLLFLLLGFPISSPVNIHQFTAGEGSTLQMHGMPHVPGTQTVWTTEQSDGSPDLRFVVHDDGGTTFSGKCTERDGHPTCQFDPWSGTLTFLNFSIDYFSYWNMYSFNGGYRIFNRAYIYARTTPVMLQPPPDAITDGESVSVQCLCERFAHGTAEVSWYVDRVKIADGDVTQTPGAEVYSVFGNATILMKEEYNGKNFTCGINSNAITVNWRVHSAPHKLNVQPASHKLSAQPAKLTNSVRKVGAQDKANGETFELKNEFESQKDFLAYEEETIFSTEFEQNYQLGAYAYVEETGNSTWYKGGQNWDNHVILKISASDGVVYSGACLSQTGEPLCDYIYETGTLIIKEITMSSRGSYHYRSDIYFYPWHTYFLEVSTLAKPEIVVKPPDVINDGDSVPVTCSVDRLYPEEVYVSWFIGTTNVTTGTTTIEPSDDVFLATNVAVITMSSADHGKNLMCVALARQHRGLSKESEPFLLNIT